MHSRSWLLRLSILAIALTTVIGFILLRAARLDGLASLQLDLAEFKPMMFAVRVSAIALLIVGWPALIRCAAGREYFSAAAAQTLLAARWRCLIWLSSLEFLIGSNGIEFVTKNLQVLAS